jgi:small subunit ribosomal protein S17
MENQLKTQRKVKKGVVVSSKMDKTVVVRVDRKIRHPQYEKVIVRSQKYYAHDESNVLKNGDEVSIMEIRPLSKTKRWCVVK